MAEWILPRSPNVKFRILIIGIGNAGKTTIIQRVINTTESSGIYRRDKSGKRELVQPNPSVDRGEHNIEDELIPSNHDGYIFHDSRGFEGGSEDEVRIVQEFVHNKSLETRLEDRLHAIWYCIPMDHGGPKPYLKYIDILTITDVPVIAVFTKYDQFKYNIYMSLQDRNRDAALLGAEMERIFHEDYLACLSMSTPFVCLEKMHKPDQRCTELIELTVKCVNALRDRTFQAKAGASQAARTNEHN